MTVPTYDLAPAAAILLGGLVLALGPLAWLGLRRRGAGHGSRLHALAVLTLFLTFDLVLLGAFTRLSDSGLGCPDWPGCYGHASPIGASGPITVAAAAAPLGPVTPAKAWIEMAHRYSATAIGGLIVAMTALALLAARRGRLPVSPWWSVATLVWVCLQGAFGAWTVTLKLYPAIVTLHLLGGLGLLALLAAQAEAFAPRPMRIADALRAGLYAVAALVLLQVALGGWVSTNYAVLACRDFPTCQGSWWPGADFGAGFALLRPLGISADGGFLPFAALTAIHFAHRLGALVVVPAVLLLGWQLLRHGGAPARAPAIVLIVAICWQAATGIGNVVLGWPLVVAVGHTGGSAALVIALTILLARSAAARRSPPQRPWQAAGHPVVS